MSKNITPSDIENIELDLPEKDVQDRMVQDIKLLTAKGMDVDKAVDWVFSNKQSYIDNTEFTSLPIDPTFTS